MAKLYKLALIIIFIVYLSGCHSKQQQQDATKIVTATLQPNTTQLYYSGTLQPLHTDSVVSPADGVVEAIHFKYGEVVQKGQLLLVVNSTKLQQDYDTAITNYIKAKDTFERSKSDFVATGKLYKAGIENLQNYESAKSTLETNELALINATNTLKQAADKLPVKQQIDYAKLSLQDIPTIRKILEKQNDRIKLYAPTTGIALFPSSADSSQGNDSSKQLTIGAEVKQAQSVLGIGHMIGLSTQVTVDELHVNQIVPGQEAIVTSPALPGISFKGKVVLVAAQAKNSDGGMGGLATFPVTIQVPTITEEQRKLIRIGMDAKIQINISGKPQIMLPINGVFQKNGINMVSVLDPKTKQQQDVPVVTGQTSLNSIAILQGIKPGDQIVIHD